MNYCCFLIQPYLFQLHARMPPHTYCRHDINKSQHFSWEINFPTSVLDVNIDRSISHQTILRRRINALKPVVTIYTHHGLTATFSTLCPQSTFMLLSFISEQTAIISLHSIKRLVFIAETMYVYCAVRTESLNIIQLHFCMQGRAMAQEIGRRPLAEIFVFDPRPAYL